MTVDYSSLLSLEFIPYVLTDGDQEPDELTPNEADDDPHRLARVNLEQYATQNDGRTLRFWRDEWYVWKGNRYIKITERELKAKVSLSVKAEFDRINIERQRDYFERKAAGEIDPDTDKGPPVAKKVTNQIISSVLQATSGMVVVSATTEPGTWLPEKSRPLAVSMVNGLVNVERVLANRDDYLLGNSPDWFAMASLPYAFDPDATCPKWLDFLRYNLDGDEQLAAVLQEWAGYLLLPTTDEQKFMILEGEGSNGKSVFTAAMTAMLGEENVSSIPLEVFGDRFSRTETLGKLLNAAGDCAELDKVCEGYIKSFTSGDRMFFDRKGVPGINCRPTARLMIACNNRPRFSDRSQGIWRRMLLVPWDRQIPEHKKIKGMSSVEWWNESGELPGIFNWAILGLDRLRRNRGFTESKKINDALRDYQEEVNPTRRFISEHFEQDRMCSVKAQAAYHHYRNWCQADGYKPMSEKSFGKEIRRAFPLIERKNAGPRTARFYVYKGIKFSQESICGQKIKIDDEFYPEDANADSKGDLF